MELLQTIIIVILIIVALVLFIFLIADIEYPPPTVISPLKSGTTIRIRSLANNKYLRVANCNANDPPSYSTCTLTPSQGWTGCGTEQPQIVADADSTDRGIDWYLSEYPGTAQTPGGNAAYIIYYGSTTSGQVMGYRIGDGFPVFLAGGAVSPDIYNQNYGKIAGSYFSFQLQENNLSTTTTGSGIYQILNGNPPGLEPDSDNIMFCSGTKDLSLYTTCTTVPTCQPAQACPVIVTMADRASTISTQDPLTYSFVIETVS